MVRHGKQCGQSRYQPVAFLRIRNIQTTVPAANNPATTAAMTRKLSSAPTVGAAPGAALCVAGAGRVGATGAAAVAAAVRGAVAAEAGAALASPGVAAGAGLGAPVGPPGGSVGSLMVGAVDGFGGKLIRTVSFLGCTLPVSFLTGGTAPVGAPGMFEGMSAIKFSG